MPKVKYKEYFELMLNNNKDLFTRFQEVHDRYALDPDTHQDEFNEIGSDVQYALREWEDKLCNRSEGSGYGYYSGRLAESFQNEARRVFPHIDKIGIVTFSVKKIKL